MIEARREHKRRALREQILDVASDLIVEGGLAAVTIDQIAERAGISQSTFFNHFPNKQALVDGLIERMIVVFERVIDQAHAVDASASTKITALFEISADLTAHRHRLLRELIAAASRSPAGAPSGLARMRSLFAGDLAEGQRQGSVRTDRDPTTLADAVLGLYVSVTLFWTTDAGYPVAERLRAAAQMAGELLGGRPGAAQPASG